MKNFYFANYFQLPFKHLGNHLCNARKEMCSVCLFQVHSLYAVIHLSDLIFLESIVAALMPILELSKNHMDPTGGEMIDKLISDVPIFTNAMGSNNLTTIHRMLSETRESLDAMASHITHAQFRKLAVERNIAFSNLVTCIHHGKCGSQEFVHFLSGSISPMKMLYTLLSN